VWFGAFGLADGDGAAERARWMWMISEAASPRQGRARPGSLGVLRVGIARTAAELPRVVTYVLGIRRIHPSDEFRSFATEPTSMSIRIACATRCEANCKGNHGRHMVRARVLYDRVQFKIQFEELCQRQCYHRESGGSCTCASAQYIL
jgi:hypothetical protein